MNEGNALVAQSPPSGMAFKPGNELVATQETAASAVAAQARAMVESRYVMALRRPRNWDQVRQDIVRECKRPSFAHNKSAFYRKPIGQGVEGLGIRFVEVALRCMTNVLVETTMVFEDATKEVHRVSVTDLESNLTYPLDVRVSKTVERSKPMDDGSYLAVRMNSYGKPVYTVPGSDDDLLNKRAALISKAIRTLGLRVIPGDLQDEAETIIKDIRHNEAAKDPEAERKRISDAFAELGVKAAQLAEYLGHDLGTCSPAELVDLRGIYGAIKDGEATWRQVIDNARGGGGDGQGLQTTGDAPGATVSELNAKIAGKKAKPAEAQMTETPKADAPTASGAPTLTLAALTDKLNAAFKKKDADLLDAHATLIDSALDEKFREEARGIYKALRAELAQ